MIENYDNDKLMAELGRRTAKFQAIRKARESIRDNAVLIGSADLPADIESYRNSFNSSVDDLIEALTVD